MNIGSLPARHGRYRPDHPAFVLASTRFSFGEFDRRTARLAIAFRRAGVHHGDRIATLLPNGSAIYEVYWAAARIGAATVPLSTLLSVSNPSDDTPQKARAARRVAPCRRCVRATSPSVPILSAR